MSDGVQSQRLTALVILLALTAGAACAQPAVDSVVMTEAACTGPALAATVPADRIGEPVSAIALDSSMPRMLPDKDVWWICARRAASGPT